MASMYYNITSHFTINRFINEGGKDGEHRRMENKAEFHDERKIIVILVRSIFVCVYETRCITVHVFPLNITLKQMTDRQLPVLYQRVM
jgi:hypothetical protein